MDGASTVGTSEGTPMGRRKPRVCQYCSRQFRRYEHLERHLRIHTNEKPYSCGCGSSFSRRDLLKRHQSIGHGPITPPTQQSSPITRNEDENHQQQGTYTQSDTVIPPFEVPDIPSTSIDVVSQNGPVADYELGGNSLLSAQDLLVLQDLAMFSDNIGLGHNEWCLPSEPSITQIFAGDSHINALQPPRVTSASHEQPSDLDQTPSRLPTEREAVAEFGVLTLPILTITKQHRESLLHAQKKSHANITDGSFPSCHALSRFINGFFDGFYPHLPVVHIPTFRVEDCEPEILLAMCALGAEFRQETRKSVLLFWAAKDMLQQTTGERDTVEIPDLELPRERAVMREARCVFLLIAFATWQSEESIAREAFNLQSTLARCVREYGLEEVEQTSTNWRSWVLQESDRRLKLFSFAFLNLHSIAFGTPPVILTDEIHLRLPCSCLEWIAPNEEKWNLVRRSVHQEQMFFQDALSHVMKSRQETHFPSSQPVPSPLANYILLNAVIQQTILAYHALGPYNDPDHTSIDGQKDITRNALHAWTALWQRAPESSLDPRNPNGPVTFTSTALLGVAYVRLAFNLGSYKILHHRDPKKIADQLLRMPSLPPGPHLLPAILHAIHALSIPVKLGVNFVAQSHAFVWSVQHSLCGLEFAVFLSKWLFCISNCQGKRSLGEQETRLLSWISDIVEEGRTSADEDLWPRPEDPSNGAYLGYAVVKLWARLIRGNEQWSLMKVIGDGLDIYADTCRERSVNFQTDALV